jgi:dephospho-CoA kinase
MTYSIHGLFSNVGLIGVRGYLDPEATAGSQYGNPGTRKPIIGITGGIGAGKSTVAEMLASQGAAVIDSDALAHEELRKAEVIGELRDWWGDRILGPDGMVSRREIGKIVFNAPEELGRLEGLLYPRIHHRRRELVERYEADPAVRAIVLDAPKLYEAGLDKFCDVIIFVDADWESRKRRVGKDRGWNETELKRREKLQIPLDTKRANADYVVPTHSGIDQLREDVDRIFTSVIASFSDLDRSQVERKTQ